MFNLEAVKRATIKKSRKRAGILTSAYDLFHENGIDNTSIGEITKNAGVAKGSFYLYFRDKEDLIRQLISHKSNELLQKALAALEQTEIDNFEDQLIFVVDYVIDEFIADKALLRIISKDLSLGMYSERILQVISDEDVDILGEFVKYAKKSGYEIKNPEITLFTIFELASSTCFNCILYSKPFDIRVYKPYLFASIRKILHD